MLVVASVAQHAPGDAGQLGGHRDGDDVGVRPCQQLAHPRPCRRLLAGEVRHGGPRAVDELRAQVAVAALADAEKLGSASGRVLPGRQPEPGCEVAPFGERRPVADGRQQRGRVDRTDAGNGRQAACRLVLAREGDQFVIVGLDATIEVGQLVTEILKQAQGARADRQLARHQLVEPLDKRSPSLGQDHAALEQHCPQLVGQPCPPRHQPLPRAVQDLQVELGLALQRDQPHGGPGRGLGDRLRVQVVRFCALT